MDVVDRDSDGGIDKSSPTITVWHLEAWQLMINTDPQEFLFLSFLIFIHIMIIFLLLKLSILFSEKKTPRRP